MMLPFGAKWAKWMFIGTNPAGTAALPDGANGIGAVILMGSSSNTIGRTTPAERNPGALVATDAESGRDDLALAMAKKLPEKIAVQPPLNNLAGDSTFLRSIGKSGLRDTADCQTTISADPNRQLLSFLNQFGEASL